jgi:hypothetical protein
MIEMILMDPSKETDNKLRWQADVEGVNFELYIPKWRVPQPWPNRILVRISDVSAEAEPQHPPATSASSASVDRPIFAIVEKVREHTQTVRFAPRGDPKGWHIGEPYIPYNLLPTPDSQALRIEVEWDRSAGTWSGE